MTETYTYDYQAELNTSDNIGALYATDTMRRATAAEALADALALQGCVTLAQAVDTGLTMGLGGDERVHPDSLLRSFRVVRNVYRNGEWINHDDAYSGPQGTYKAALTLVDA
jgi:hypothetical protein